MEMPLAAFHPAAAAAAFFGEFSAGCAGAFPAGLAAGTGVQLVSNSSDKKEDESLFSAGELNFGACGGADEVAVPGLRP